MANEIVIAAAGGGKTTRLVERARAHAGRVAIVTYTSNNVQEIKNKFFGLDASLPPSVEIWSWFRFLLHEMARPYQGALLDRRIEGLHWVEGRSAPRVPRFKAAPFFLSADGRMYSDKIARFAVEADVASRGKMIARLKERFETVFIDEIQDMAGYDLDLIELMLRSKINVVMVGDHRQSTFKTNNAARNSGYVGAKIIDKFREWEKIGLAQIAYAQETHRCHQLIADVADSFYPHEPKTISKSNCATAHDGVFLVSPDRVQEYVERYQPQVLRLDRRTNCQDHPALNFGEAKGMTFARVLIFPHENAKKWLSSADYALVEGSAAKMYVGITRARHSVSFVFDGECKIKGFIRYE